MEQHHIWRETIGLPATKPTHHPIVAAAAAVKQQQSCCSSLRRKKAHRSIGDGKTGPMRGPSVPAAYGGGVGDVAAPSPISLRGFFPPPLIRSLRPSSDGLRHVLVRTPFAKGIWNGEAPRAIYSGRIASIAKGTRSP